MAQQNLICNGNMDEVDLKVVRFSEGDTSYILSDTVVCGNKVKTHCWEYASNGLHALDSGSYNGCCYRWINLFSAIDNKYYGVNSSRAMFVKPLEKGKKYHFSIKVKLMPDSKPFTSLDFVVLQDAYSFPPFAEFEKQESYRAQTPPPIYSYSGKVDKQYTEVAFTYTAAGGEQYVYIGNTTATKPASFKFKHQPLSTYQVQIGIDDFKVFEIDDVVEKISIKKEKAKSNYTITTFYFNSDSFNVTKEIEDSLKKLCRRIDTSQEVIVEGHTDFTGTETYNKDLSEKRAKEIANILIKECKVNVTPNGLGSTQPQSNIIEGQSNRRVVVKYFQLP